MSQRVTGNHDAAGAPRKEWHKPDVQRLQGSAAQTGIEFGPEILILVS